MFECMYCWHGAFLVASSQHQVAGINEPTTTTPPFDKSLSFDKIESDLKWIFGVKFCLVSDVFGSLAGNCYMDTGYCNRIGGSMGATSRGIIFSLISPRIKGGGVESTTPTYI